jgi:hypothetical protein
MRAPANIDLCSTLLINFFTFKIRKLLLALKLVKASFSKSGAAMTS